MNNEAVRQVQERRRSNAAGSHSMPTDYRRDRKSVRDYLYELEDEESFDESRLESC